jgi:hypothetical protein
MGADERHFQQLADRPSSMSCFIALIELSKILASILTQLVRNCIMFVVPSRRQKLITSVLFLLVRDQAVEADHRRRRARAGWTACTVALRASSTVRPFCHSLVCRCLKVNRQVTSLSVAVSSGISTNQTRCSSSRVHT